MAEFDRTTNILRFDVDDDEYRKFYHVNIGANIVYELHTFILDWCDTTGIEIEPIVKHRFIGIKFKCPEDAFLFRAYWLT